MPAPIVANFACPLSPILETPVLPPSPTVEDYRRARDIEKAKADQARRHLEILKKQLEDLNDICDKRVDALKQHGGEITRVGGAHFDNNRSSSGKQPGTDANAQPMRRSSSLNGAAPPFVPSFAMGGGDSNVKDAA
ncbi:hypothetical protein MPH_00287 [Macrophomina phaseolina MS6]|uniref:Uncharacterized protein n=1 Tax=Macrophomina phaseolina (strain MS6) TaxID=1126212 RepID=K2SBP7_MACPH|nr:hypothetical protein MPH_00287 [Macrophomina phaseolina MS6]